MSQGEKNSGTDIGRPKVEILDPHCATNLLRSMGL